jgi:hypothetical protein
MYGLLVASGALSTAILYSFVPDDPIPALVAALLTLPFAVLLYRAFRSKSGLRATPQFTRQNLRERREE